MFTFSVWPEIPFLGKFDQKTQNSSKWNLIPNLIGMVVLTLSVLGWKYLLWEGLVQKVNCLFKLKFGT